MRQTNLNIILTILFVLIAYNILAQKTDSLLSREQTVLIDSSTITNDADIFNENLKQIEIVSQNDSNSNDKPCSCLWQSLMSIFAPIIGIFGSLLLFYFKLKSDKKKEKDELARSQKEEADKKQQENDNYWKYLLLVIDNIIKNTKEQSDFCQKFSDRLKNENLRPTILEWAASFSLNRFLDKTDEKELLHHFLIKKGDNQDNIELFNEIYKNLDFVKALLEKMFETNENFQKDLNNQRQIFSVQFDNFKEYLITIEAEIKSTSDKNDDDISLQGLIKETILEYLKTSIDSNGKHQIENDNIGKLYELLPQKLLTKLQKSYKGSKYYWDLFLRCKNIKFSYLFLFKTVSNQINTFENYSISLEKESKDLENLKKKIMKPINGQIS